MPTEANALCSSLFMCQLCQNEVVHVCVLGVRICAVCMLSISALQDLPFAEYTVLSVQCTKCRVQCLVCSMQMK